MRNATTLAAGVLLWALLILSACDGDPVVPDVPDDESAEVLESAVLLHLQTRDVSGTVATSRYADVACAPSDGTMVSLPDGNPGSDGAVPVQT